MNACDLGAEFLVVAPALACLARLPGVEPAPGHLVVPAQERHRVLRPVLGYELELRLRRSILKRMAFFKRSCSTSSAASFRSSARTSRRAWTFASSCFTWRLSARFSGSAFGTRSSFEPALAVVLLPLREHERVDIQCVRHVLGLDLRMIRQLHRLNLELQRIAMNLLRTHRCCHLNLLFR